MSVAVVDLFESVEVAHPQAAGDLLLLVGGDEHFVNAVELGSIGHLGQRVLRGLFVEALASLFEGDFRGGVVEQEHGPLRDALLRRRRGWRAYRRPLAARHVR